MAKRNYPNDYYCWFNDDARIAILERRTSTDSSQTHKETWDSFQSGGDLSGDVESTSTSSTVVITSTGHGLTNNDRVTISGTTTYDGNRTITKVNDDTFSITDSNSTNNETGTWNSLFIDDGLRLTFHSKYEAVTAVTNDLQTSSGLDSGMHQALVCYLKARLLEDIGEVQQAMYFRQMFNDLIGKYPSRKSGIRALSVPRL